MNLLLFFFKFRSRIIVAIISALLTSRETQLPLFQFRKRTSLILRFCRRDNTVRELKRAREEEPEITVRRLRYYY